MGLLGLSCICFELMTTRATLLDVTSNIMGRSCSWSCFREVLYLAYGVRDQCINVHTALAPQLNKQTIYFKHPGPLNSLHTLDLTKLQG
jgi:hypothetical protein